MSFRIWKNIQNDNRVSKLQIDVTDMQTTIDNMITNEPVKPSELLDFRSLDGFGNNIKHPEWGSILEPLTRMSDHNYQDGISSIAVRGGGNPNPRIISNAICKIGSSITLSQNNLSNMTWVWGQFLDHEIDLTGTNTGETANIVTPEDPEEDYPNRTIVFTRSKSVSGLNPREQPNEITSYIDATNVYGNETTRLNHLRLLDGSGKLKTQVGDNGEILLPFNTFGITMAGNGDPTSFFAAGDIRANENVLLTAMHTIFVREHNRLCDQIVLDHPDWISDEELIFQHARRFIVGFMQNITYKEFLPQLIGSSAIPNYNNYDETVSPCIHTEFSTCGYRLGHSMITSELQIGENPGTSISLRDGFFSPNYVKVNGADLLLLGSIKTKMKEIDGTLIDDLRNFLFGPPEEAGGTMLDLASLNIQRGRDHGIPNYKDRGD